MAFHRVYQLKNSMMGKSRGLKSLAGLVSDLCITSNCSALHFYFFTNISGYHKAILKVK